FKAVLIFMLSLPAASLSAGQKIPERLEYSLSWGIVPVGSAIQEIVEVGEVRKLLSLAKSNDWLSGFYPVEDRTESLIEKNGDFPGRVRSFRMIFKEGARLRDREILFDRASGKALFHDRVSKEQLDIQVEPGTFDIYSSFYYARHQRLEPGKSLFMHVLDCKTLYRLEVRVLKKERIKVPAGEFDTIKIEPVVKPEGIFEGKRGTIIWLSDDSRRIPVKVQTLVRVGRVTAVLTGGNY
ncbi:MAG TPA: DUF3108 domain-containing protein, partial [Geobacteraceae bacterium]|nr:DUF3108 domain-containing protein [Geobacteraceae bacterium]